VKKSTYTVVELGRRNVNYIEFVTTETKFMQPEDHAYNLILKGISNIPIWLQKRALLTHAFKIF